MSTRTHDCALKVREDGNRHGAPAAHALHSGNEVRAEAGKTSQLGGFVVVLSGCVLFAIFNAP
ncbi:hypothetical protein ACFYNY_34100 [Streptomyces sp. NPDC006530]|uniref:hypothetical protein n=1 Tax=Streptomyces sp. NPDC006530 TaxID=3364750 RepID=UPI0036A8D553